MPPAPAKPGPDADRPGPVLLGEGRGDDRQGDRHDHRRTDAGDHPGDQQHLDGRRERSADVGEGEHDEAGEQDVLAAPPVTDRADRQEQRGEGDRVPVDDPQELALGGAEVEGQVLLGDVEARDRRDDGDERHDHRDEDPSLPLRVGDRGLRPECDRRGRGRMADRVLVSGEVVTMGHRSAGFVIRNGIVLFMENSTPAVYALLCATVVTGGTGGRSPIATRRRSRSACRPQPCRRDLGGDRVARRGRTVGGDDRRHRRPVGRRQVDDLPALGVARRRAARRDGGLRARPRRRPTRRSASRAGCARSPIASAAMLNDPEWARVLPALLMLKTHAHGIADLEKRLEERQNEVLDTLIRRGVAEGLLSPDGRRSRGDRPMLVGPLFFAQLTGLGPDRRRLRRPHRRPLPRRVPPD